MIVRENSEGEYAGMGGRAHRGTRLKSHRGRGVHSRRGRTHHPLRLRARPHARAQQLTVVTKSNAQRHGMVLWDEVAVEVAREYPDVRWDRELVDAMTVRMVQRTA